MRLSSHLIGRHFSVSGAEGDAQFEALLLDLLHARQGGTCEVGGGHVVIAHLLVARRHLAHHCSASHLEIHAL